MNFRNILLLTLVLCISIVTSVSAMTVSYQNHIADVQFYGDGTGVATSGSYGIPFKWNEPSDFVYVVKPDFPYNLYADDIRIVYDVRNDSLVAPDYPDARFY